MALAKDELIGLVIAGVVGAAALATYAYRQHKAARPAVAVVEPVAAIDDQAARDEFAELLLSAFVQDQNAATVTADGTTLHIKWEMCSKQMLGRLLRDDKNFQVQNIRALSGISVKRLKSHGFKKVTCDDGRKGLAPAVEKL